VQEARIRKAKEFLADGDKFVEFLHKDVELLAKEAEKKSLIPAVRLNGTTDIRWEAYKIIQSFPEIQFYDYTKHPIITRYDLPTNYHLTFSYSEHKRSLLWSREWFNHNRCVNTAVVFRGALPSKFLLTGIDNAGFVTTIDRPVINGDESDLRFLDPKGVFVGLKAKGKARPEEAGAGFVISV
jgi:hypothetical protein